MAVTRYATRYSRAFKRIWDLHGQPSLSIVDPIANWTLGAGVTYDAYQDQFIDGVGATVSVSWSGQPATSANFIPTRQNNDVSLTIGGLMTAGAINRNVVIQWTSALQSKVDVCYGVAINSTLYNVKAWEVYPMGTTAPVEIRLTLTEAES